MIASSRTRAVAAVTLKAIAAGEATSRLEQRLRLRQVLQDFVKTLRVSNGQSFLLDLRRVRAIPEMQAFVPDDFVPGSATILGVTEVGINMPRGVFAMPYRDSYRSIRGYHVATREDAVVAGHHVGVDLDRVVPLELDTGDGFQEGSVGILPNRQDQRVGFQFLKFAGRLRPTILVKLHDLDFERRLVNFLDRSQPVDLDALFDRFVRLEIVRRHAAAIAAIDDHRFHRAQAFGGARGIHGRIAAAIDRDSAPNLRRLALFRLAQETHGVENLARVAIREYRSSC